MLKTLDSGTGGDCDDDLAEIRKMLRETASSMNKYSSSILTLKSSV